MTKQTPDYLNDVLQLLYNSAESYKIYAKNVSDAHLRELFTYLQQQRSMMIDELKTEIESLNGEPEEAGTLIGKAYELYEVIKTLMTNGDPVAIIKGINRGETILIESYKKTLEEEIPEKVKKLLQNHLKQIENELQRVNVAA